MTRLRLKHSRRTNIYVLLYSLSLMVLTLAGCVSTEKQLERAISYEESGDYVRAARYYVSVLKREPDMNGARDGLIRTGAIAVDNYIDEARDLELQGSFDEAIRVLDVMEELRTDARDAGVELTVPPDHAAYRDRLATAAVNALVEQGRRAEEQGNWEEALEHYQRVLTAYVISVDRTEEMHLAQARVYVKWGLQDIERSYFRSAYNRGAEAIRILGEDHPRSIAAIELQDRAITEGTQYVTFFPTSATADVAEVAPRGLLDEFNDLMQFDFWGTPPSFIASSDPVQMRRELRRSNPEDELTSINAIQIGRLLESDYVVVSRALQFQLEETRVRDRTIEAQTRGRNSLDTTYVKRAYTARLTAEIAYSVLEVESREEVDAGTVQYNVTQRMERGIYSGDYQDLDLSYNEQRLFDPEELEEALRDLEDELLDGLAPRLADELYEKILSRIY